MTNTKPSDQHKSFDGANPQALEILTGKLQQLVRITRFFSTPVEYAAFSIGYDETQDQKKDPIAYMLERVLEWHVAMIDHSNSSCQVFEQDKEAHHHKGFESCPLVLGDLGRILQQLHRDGVGETDPYKAPLMAGIAQELGSLFAWTLQAMIMHHCITQQKTMKIATTHELWVDLAPIIKKHLNI